MKIGVLQFCPEFGQTGKNLDRLDEMIHDSDADLLVMPELCTTGYQFLSREELSRYTEEIPGGYTCERLAETARKRNIAVIAGMVEEDGGKLYNSSVFCDPGGYRGKYRKIHLFNEEKLIFDPGAESLPVFDFRGARVGLMICFDWIFPESSRTLALKGADIICVSANLILPYCQTSMVTRALENGVFTAVANRVGVEAREGKDRLEFTGRSQITDNRGKILVRLGPKEEREGVVGIEPREARDKRITERNHLLDDRRKELYRL